MFWLAGNEIGFLELYIAKKRFCFLFAKTRCTHTKNMFWPVSRKVVLFPALLQREKDFLPVCSKSPCVFLDFTQNNVFSWLAKWQRFLKFLVRLRCFQHHLSGNSLIAFLSFLITKIRSFQLYLTKNQFCSVYRQIWLFPALLRR